MTTTKYMAVIVKYGEKKNVTFTLHILSAIEFCARLKYYGWRIESLKRIVML